MNLGRLVPGAIVAVAGIAVLCNVARHSQLVPIDGGDRTRFGLVKRNAQPDDGWALLTRRCDPVDDKRT